MGDSQLCVECYKKLGGTNTLPDINSECAVLPDNAYFLVVIIYVIIVLQINYIVKCVYDFYLLSC
uniref:Uncharacterized protein n=1 Tax=Pieris brassicae granulosis virus TaxID=10465 RepID=A0A7G9U8R9_GVPB|nr:hypothetical protein [Pieris brassicae granulovirus]